MPQSSEHIAVIAGALARAQAELMKSNDVATYRAQFLKEPMGDPTARQAWLDAGVDFVRHSFGQQNIAIIQTTRTDTITGHLFLTTLLAHASGEWISSELPILANRNTLDKVGQALAHARQYAVLTIVGLVTCDLTKIEPASTAESIHGSANTSASAAPGQDAADKSPVNLETSSGGVGDLAFPKEPARRRSKVHLSFVRGQACLVCQSTPADAHHLKFAQPSTLGRKVSDEFTVPLCRLHHQSLHRHGNERSWWANHQIDSLSVAAELWAKSPVHPDALEQASDQK